MYVDCIHKSQRNVVKVVHIKLFVTTQRASNLQVDPTDPYVYARSQVSV
jgi:hypothetical protein